MMTASQSFPLFDHSSLPPPPDVYEFDTNYSPPLAVPHKTTILNEVSGGARFPKIVTNDVALLGENAAPGGAEIAVSGGATDIHKSGRPRRNVGTYKDGPAKICRLPIDG